MNTKRLWKFVALGAVLVMAAAACGDDDDTPDTTVASVDASGGSTGTTAAPDTATTAAPGGGAISDADKAAAKTRLDTNGDGKVVVGIAAAGPADDGAYYQAVVDAAKDISTNYGFETPIVSDKIEAAGAETALSNLAEQNVDVIIVGASEIAGPLKGGLLDKYPKIFWYCNCGAGFPENPGLAQSLDDGSEIHFAAGYATGLKLAEKGGEKGVMIGCCDLGFEKEAFMAFELGLQTADPKYTITYVKSGSFDFDFDNTANALAAYNAAKADGAKFVYPYLGGALKPVVEAANKDGLITMSAGSSKVCKDGGGLKYDIAVRFDGGDYVQAVMGDIVSGKFTEGTVKTFHVGVDPQPGAEICGASADQQAKMDAVYKDIAAGKYAAKFGEIKGKAYAG